MGLLWSIHFHFLNLYTGSVVARDLQVQIKIAIENSLLSKTPYETIRLIHRIYFNLKILNFTILKNLDNHLRSSVNCTCALILCKSLKMVICSIKNFWNLCKKLFFNYLHHCLFFAFQKSHPVNLVYIFFCSAPP